MFLKLSLPLAIAFLSLGSAQLAFSQAIQNDQVPPGKVFANISAGLNDVEDGITQTDKSASLKAGFGYNWTQFKFGLYGQNVHYSDSGDTVVFKAVPAYRFVFTSKWDLTVDYQFRRSYASGDHNDGVVGVDLGVYEYHVVYEYDDQWEGTGTSTSRLAVWREIPIANNNLLWHIEGGYNLTSTYLTNKYFDFKTAIVYKAGDVNLSAVLTDSTATGAFKDPGSMQVYLQMAVLL